MDVGAGEIVDVIVGSTTGYLAEYSPIFLLIGGIVLAVAVIAMLLFIFTGRQLDVFGDDEGII